MGAPDAESAWFDQHPENIRRSQAAEMGASLWAQVANWPGHEGRLSIFYLTAWIGSSIKAANQRTLRLSVRVPDAIDKVEVLKNGRVIRRFFPQHDEPGTGVLPYRLRITWGWGSDTKVARWNAKLTISEGSISNIETCFSGQPIVAPKNNGDDCGLDGETIPHALLEHNECSCTWRSVTTGNLSMRHATTQALSLGIEAPLRAVLTVEVNDQLYRHPLTELLRASRTHFLNGLASHAIYIGPLVPETDCVVLISSPMNQHKTLTCTAFKWLNTMDSGLGCHRYGSSDETSGDMCFPDAMKEKCHAATGEW